MGFVNLHLHSDASIRDSIITPDGLAARLQEIGQNKVAITDHGSLSGIMHAWRVLGKKGIDLIPGIEAYYVSDVKYKEEKGERMHVTLLADGPEGYKNLCAINGIAERQNKMFGFPRIDMDLMQQYSDGVIMMTGCMGGPVYRALAAGNFDSALDFMSRAQHCFGKDNVYVEIHNHSGAQYKTLAEGFSTLARRSGAKLVGCVDAHMLRPEDHYLHRILVSVRFSGGDMHEGYPQEVYVQSEAEAKQYFSRLYSPAMCQEAMDSTVEIASRCRSPFDKDMNFMPKMASTPKEEFEILKQRVIEGLRTLDIPASKRQEYLDRVKYELKMIAKLGFQGYFILVQDIIRFAKSHDIYCGYGRGSSSGAIVCWALGITNVDPIKHGLYFERFLNPGRASSPPDIDIDIQSARRDEVIQYIKNQYGTVLPVITWSRIHGRTALKDVGRILGFPFEELNELTQKFPSKASSIKDAMEKSQDFNKVARSPRYNEIIAHAQRLEGLRRQTGRHAAAVAVLTEEAAKIVPVVVVKTGSGKTAEYVECAGFDMYDIDAMKCLKIDVLGLSTLDIIQDVEREHGKIGDTLNIADIENDSQALDLISEGNTVGVFQLEQPWMTDFVKKLKPQGFHDIYLTIAAYRPGPMEFIPKILDIRSGKSVPEYPAPGIEHILEPTYGFPIYQEQIIRIMQDMGGMTASEADIVRRAMGKKIASEMERMQQKFKEGAVAKGFDQEQADIVWAWCDKFSGYGFNISHSVSYGMLSMVTAALKARYPATFFSALINSAGSGDAALYVGEAAMMGVEMRPPDINKSEVRCSTESSVEGGIKDAVRWGLVHIKNVGESVAEAIVGARRKFGPYKDIEQVIDRCQGLDRRSLESLISCGAMDAFGKNRAAVLEVMKKSWGKRKKRGTAPKGVVPLFDLPPMRSQDYPDIQDLALAERCSQEFDLLGFSLGAKDLRSKLSSAINRRVMPSYGLRYVDGRHDFYVFGRVQDVKHGTNSKGDPSLSVDLTDFTGYIHARADKKAMRKVEGLLRPGAWVVLKGMFKPPVYFYIKDAIGVPQSVLQEAI